jgi:hypothetical protein
MSLGSVDELHLTVLKFLVTKIARTASLAELNILFFFGGTIGPETLE